MNETDTGSTDRLPCGSAPWRARSERSLSQNPDTPGHFRIFHGNHVRLLWRILSSRARSDESTGSTEREAEQNDRDLRHQIHRLIPKLSSVFHP